MNVGTKFLSIPDMEEPRHPGQILEREIYFAVCPLVREAYFVVWGMKMLREIHPCLESLKFIEENVANSCDSFMKSICETIRLEN